MRSQHARVRSVTLTTSLLVILALHATPARAQVDIPEVDAPVTGEVGDTVNDAVDDVADTVGDSVGDVGDTVGDTVGGDTGGTIDDVTGDVGDTISGTGDEAGDTVGGTVGGIEDTITDGDVGGILDDDTTPGSEGEPGDDGVGLPTDGAQGEGQGEDEGSGSAGGGTGSQDPSRAETSDVTPADEDLTTTRSQLSNTPEGVAGSIVESAKRFAFPLALALLVAVFLAIQNRLDRKDPKLALAMIDPADDHLSFT